MTGERMENQLKVTIELDLSKPNDQKLIEVISRVRAAQAQGQELSLSQAVNQATNEEPLANAGQLIESGIEVDKAATDLEKKITGDTKKMTTKERAKVAADARWARERARKAGLPLPPTARELKKKARAADDGLDYTKAKEEPSDQYQVESLEVKHNNFLQQLTQPPPSVDGREIMSGSWQHREDHQEFLEGGDSHQEIELPEYMNDDNYMGEIRERAKSYE